MCSSYTPLSINAAFYRYLKLPNATCKGKKSKQGFEVTPTGNQTQNIPHSTESHALKTVLLGLQYLGKMEGLICRYAGVTLDPSIVMM